MEMIDAGAGTFGPRRVSSLEGDSNSQSNIFKQAAAEADQDEDAFKRRLRRVAKAPAPKPTPSKKA